MNKKSSIVNYFFIFLSILLYAYLIIKISKLYFLNPPDEYEFKKLILKTNINNYDFTSPLYIFLYSFIKNFENNFYLYTKYLNLIFFLGGNIFVYFITKNLSNNFLAKIVFLLSSIYPYHLYTSAVMPESLFYFYFYFTFYLFLTIQNTNLKYVITSLNFFNLFLIKGTGLFIFIAFLLSEIVSYYKIKKKIIEIYLFLYFFLYFFIFFFI